ncbi:MAG: hypothetical protein NPIRA05_04360 [Nitrospirales bacterium]|nr:MAG: hypothetical protein NPIRA05_04360 [Nitrospirales bacterium]
MPDLATMLLDEITPLRSLGEFWLGFKGNDISKALEAEFTRIVGDDGDDGIQYSSRDLRFVLWTDYGFKLDCIGV